MGGTGWYERTSRQAAVLRRDLQLIATHIHTLPLLFGTPRWWLFQRYSFSRPFSEMRFSLYPLELIRIVALFFISLPIASIFICTILYTLFLHAIANFTHIRLLALPLRLLIDVLPKFLGATQTAEVQRPRSLLAGTRTFIARVDQGDQDEVWYFINGVAVQGDMVFATAELLRAMTGRMVNTYVNPSNGVPLDLLECILGRTLDVASAPAQEMYTRVQMQLDKGRRVILVAHSQGGIILSNVLRLLVANNNQEQLRRLESYSFASAADESPCGPFAEHFATQLDFVARIGALTFSGALDDHSDKSRQHWNGRMYMLPANLPGQGHLMKEMLLPALKQGLYGRQSRFWNKYCDHDSENFKPVSFHLVEDVDIVER